MFFVQCLWSTILSRDVLIYLGRLAISYILTVCKISNYIIKAVLTADGESTSNIPCASYNTDF